MLKKINKRSIANLKGCKKNHSAIVINAKIGWNQYVIYLLSWN